MSEGSLVDTNVLLDAIDPARQGHRPAREFLDSPGRLAVTPQVLREFLVVSTRPGAVNGMDHPPGVAADNVERLVGRLSVLPDDARVALRLRELVIRGDVRGMQIHDANLVAAALVHGMTRLVTSNARHFSRFADLIEIVSLA